MDKVFSFIRRACARSKTGTDQEFHMARPLQLIKAHNKLLVDGFKATAPAFAAVLIFSFFINLLMFVSPLYMLQIYDRVITSRSETTLIGITILAALLLLVCALLEMLRSRIFVRAGILFDRKVADPIFDAVHRGNLHQPNGAHAQCLRDIDSLREFVTGPGMIAFCDAPWFPVFVAAAFMLHPWFGYIAIIGGAIIVSLTLLNEFMTKKHLEKASQSSLEAHQCAQATFRNTEVLQAMGMLHALRARWSRHHGSVLCWQASASDRVGIIVALTKFSRMLLQTAILGVGAYLVIERQTSPGTMIAASILISRALAPIEQVVASWKGFVTARGALRRLSGLLDVAGPPEQRMALPRPAGRLNVEAVTAAAPGTKSIILRNVSFALDAGESLGIVGPSAAGKSSLARVLVGVWPVMAGAVRLDGADISHWDPQQLGRHVGYLPQDVELFPGTVAQNIARFQDVDDQAVITAAEMAGCHDLIQRLPNGYNTQIGEGGAVLSGGQRQRVGLARALYGTPSFVVLDEPNASLDSAGEEALLLCLQKLKAKNTTVVLVTHKLNTLSVTDKILVMAAGTAQSFGERDKVLAQMRGPRIVPGAPASVAAPAAVQMAK
ncbi:type I secretion system permease/ATPase [Xanthobacter sp. V2C-4]|uniref:type I secretion system permease/ATPase n=1 Tax=Xanthobacter albus TaxID=3119929 RepID=UPI003728F6E2